MIILGINSVYHDSSACIIKDGQLLAAVEEERFSRVRHCKPANLLNPHHLPIKSIEYCLEKAQITPESVDLIGYSFVPQIRYNNNVAIREDKEIIENGPGSESGEEVFLKLNLSIPSELSKFLNCDIRGRFVWIEHHLCHASSAFFVSPFHEAAILSVDGIGEYTTTWIGKGIQNKIYNLKTINYPNSVGFLWEKVSKFLGFGEYGAWKVMGLSAYGNSDKFYNQFLTFITYDKEHCLLIDNSITEFRSDGFFGLEKVFFKHRKEEDPILQEHMDIAAALQKITNDIMLNFAECVYEVTSAKKLVIAGGVGLNCVTNNYLSENSHFEEVFIQPASNDAGTAIGACYYLWNHVNNKKERFLLKDVFLGPEYSNAYIDKILSKYNIRKYSNKNYDLQDIVSELIAKGEIVSWFNGRMEFGPRALGHRSILADPRLTDVAEILNAKVKHRELFRPFAASVLAEEASEWFKIEKLSYSDRFMLLSRQIKEDKIGRIPAVTHFDNSCRIQIVIKEENPSFYDLISQFYKITGVPMLLNTSFNDSEPIVCSPEDAINTCKQANIRWLVINDLLFEL